ncbi:hypothetical protein EI94DRAFT_1704575 [Lactarius quietus]|nr:hypothetical protein EI94DRAFT_1704575 [Lactarius quietus]
MRSHGPSSKTASTETSLDDRSDEEDFGKELQMISEDDLGSDSDGHHSVPFPCTTQQECRQVLIDPDMQRKGLLSVQKNSQHFWQPRIHLLPLGDMQQTWAEVGWVMTSSAIQGHQYLRVVPTGIHCRILPSMHRKSVQSVKMTEKARHISLLAYTGCPLECLTNPPESDLVRQIAGHLFGSKSLDSNDAMYSTIIAQLDFRMDYSRQRYLVVYPMFLTVTLT